MARSLATLNRQFPAWYVLTFQSLTSRTLTVKQKGNSITQEWCNTQKEVFQEEIYPFNEFGGMASMGRGMNLGMVLVMSLWDDHYASMLWLDSNYPTDQDPEKPGIARGECDITSGVPADVESASPNAQVVFSNIKFGPIGSTFAQPV
jgi:cellulose 1,4-beta-cellobiosidase